MKETALQSDVVDAVKEAGGMANKMSNRFIIGVADLLIKLPDPKLPAMIVEVKKNSASERILKLGVTALQEKYLCDYAACGMLAGVLSFVVGPKRNLKIAAFEIADIMARDYVTYLSDYDDIPLGQRGPSILKALNSFAINYHPIITGD